MRVLYITTVPAPYKVQFFEELGKLCDLTVIFELNDVSYRENGWMQTSFKNFKGEYLSGIKVKNMLLYSNIVKYLKKSTYDLIIIGVYSTIPQMIAQVYMKYKNIPYIISSDGGLIKSESKIAFMIKKYFISAASAWLSTGKVTNEYLEYYGASKDKIYVYPFTSINECDILDSPLTVDEKMTIRAKLGIKEEKMLISVGQFIYRKGYDILLKACESLDKKIGVYIVGGKPTEEYLQMKREMNLTNVHFVDFMGKSELSEYYKAADLFVLPTREDIWGLVVNEAMAYGLPIITTDKCGAGIEIGHQCSSIKIVNISSINSVYKELIETLKLINNENAKVSVEILNCCKKYTIEKMAKCHYAIFNKVVRQCIFKR